MVTCLQFTRPPGFMHHRGAFGLDTDNDKIRIQRLPHQAGAAQSTTTTNRHEYRIKVRNLLHYLQRGGGNARDQVGFIGRMDEMRAMFAGELPRPFERRVEIRSVPHNISAKPLHRRELEWVGMLRYENGRLRAKSARRIGHRLTVIAGRRAHNSTPALVLRKSTHQVESATDLERADRLQVLAFDVDRRADAVRKLLGIDQWRRRQMVCQHPARPIDITKGRQLARPDCCLLYTSPSPRDRTRSRMPSS